MSNIHEMLGMNGGSFQRAEKMAIDLIAKGEHAVWLDLSLLMHAQGNLDGSRKAQAEYEKYFPNCPRLKFGMTWMKMHDGDLHGGLEHIEAGRACGTLGNPDFSKIKKPRWDGKLDLKRKTVLLYGEGGQGDQIMGLRSAKHLADKGAKVIVACSKSLLKLFQYAPGVSSVVCDEMAHGVSYDYWVPMMSSFHLCNMTWETLWSGPYLQAPEEQTLWKRIIPREKDVLNVGIRWRGNPEFEHEQLRWFPPELMFLATENPKIKLYSLQKDDESISLPSHITDLSPLLGNWEQTAMAMDQLDLVISSCTSIAHLSAAMGKETWVVVPAMPYYPWARPGRKSDWYPSVTLFRQKCFGEWIPPFVEIKECLTRKVNKSPMVEICSEEFYKIYGKPDTIKNNWYMEGTELAVLEGLAKKYYVNSVLEIGINKGETAKRLLDNCPFINKYDGIEVTPEGADSMRDCQREERDSLGNEVGKFVKDNPKVSLFISKNGSKDFKINKIYDLIFIDGNHAKEWVDHDTKLALLLEPKIIVWHDYGTEAGVTDVLDSMNYPIKRVMNTRMAYLILDNKK